MRKGQSWSIDVVVGVVIFGFISLAIVNFALLENSDVDDLQNSAERVLGELEDVKNCGPVMADDALNNQSIVCLYNLNYTQIKEELRVDDEFCVYFEDENGQVITFDKKGGWGSSELIVGGSPCGQPLA